MASRERDSLGNGEEKRNAAELEAESEEEREKFVGGLEEGFRWQVWWVLMTFVRESPRHFPSKIVSVPYFKPNLLICIHH